MSTMMRLEPASATARTSAPRGQLRRDAESVPGFDEILARRFLNLVLDPAAGCMELRVLRAVCDRRGAIRRADAAIGEIGSTFAGWFEDADTLIQQAKRLRAVSAYVSINPVNRDLMARSDHLLSRVRATTRDQDIVAVRWLYIDIDPVRPADISSTETELAAAVARRDEILGNHPELADSALWGRSGNGCWILVRLPDYPNDQATRSLVSLGIQSLAERYNDQSVTIDTATVNPSRLIGLPGTLKTKGSSRTDRPWRSVTLDGIGGQVADTEVPLAKQQRSRRRFKDEPRT